MDLFRSDSGRVERQLHPGKHERQRYGKQADSSAEKLNRFVCLHKAFCRIIAKAGVPNRSGSGGVLVTLSPGTKSLASRRETLFCRLSSVTFPAHRAYTGIPALLRAPERKALIL